MYFDYYDLFYIKTIYTLTHEINLPILILTYNLNLMLASSLRLKIKIFIFM